MAAQKTSGLVVIGDGNTVNMNGGLELIGEKTRLQMGRRLLPCAQDIVIPALLSLVVSRRYI